MANRNTQDDEIDYGAEGKNPPHEKDDPTNEGYDEAAHSGPNRYGVNVGEGGVFGTSGGGTADIGMQVEERPVVYDGGGDDSGKVSGVRGERPFTEGTPRDEES
ncbi:MAG TPA: hypothetical protein VGF48_24535 [Thermoanaerobaculia bacterium]|jgi:hypothetical protein